ncbi:MAG: glycosyltransferase [Nanoarchaeota archaeon]
MAKSVSVCIPAHNEEKYIGNLLRTLQSVPVDEVLVCLSGCTDRTGEIARTYGADLIESEIGKPAAWNALMETAKGERRVFYDGDVSVSVAGVEALVRGLDVPGTVFSVTHVRSYASMNGMAGLIGPFLFRHLEDGRLCGTGYAFEADTLVDRMRSAGYARMPMDVLAEDYWLECLAPDAITLMPGAYVDHPVGGIDDFLRVHARVQAGRQQMMLEYPDLVLKNAHANKGFCQRCVDVYLQSAGLCDVLHRAGVYAARRAVLRLYGGRFDELRREMDMRCENAAHLLACAGRGTHKDAI